MAAKSAAAVSSGSGPLATETEAVGGDMRQRWVRSGGRRRRRAAGRGGRGRVRRSALDRTAEGDPRRGVVGVGAEAVACIAATPNLRESLGAQQGRGSYAVTIQLLTRGAGPACQRPYSNCRGPDAAKTIPEKIQTRIW
jgi:hypothetical protein